MDDEFALCWNNFQDNIATGFQNLYDRGDLVDVTIACDGKLLQAHKIVLAICSPYFQEMFISNPCKHPIIILKDVGYSVMCELLQFMYQGVVNVKHTELSSFMKIAQTLQIKGLATSSTQKSPSQTQSTCSSNKNSGNSNNNDNQQNNIIETKINSSAYLGNKQLSENSSSSVSSLKRDFTHSETLSIYPKKQLKRSSELNDHDVNSDSMDNMNPDDAFLPPIPQISMIESRFDLNNVKREFGDHPTSPGGVRNSMPPPFNFDYNMYANKPSIEYPNDLHMTNDFPKGAGNHMDIPPVGPGERWFQGKLEFMLSQRGKPLLVHDGHTFGIQYIRKDKKYWQCNLSRKFNCKARVTTTDTGEIIVTNNEHCHTEIRQHLRKDYHRNKYHFNSSGSNNISSNNNIKLEQQNSNSSCPSNNNNLPEKIENKVAI